MSSNFLKIKLNFFKAIFLQFSGILGAGIFALPYLFYYSNFTFATVVLVFVAVFMAILNLFYIDIILHTTGDHQLSGYAQIYLGSKSKFLSVLNLLFLGFGGILAYLKLASIVLPLVFPSISQFWAAIIFLLFLGIFHLGQIRICKFIFQILPIISLLLILFLFFFSFNFPQGNLDVLNPNLLCFGGIIFALAGFTIIPEVEETLRFSHNKKILLKLSSLIGLVLATLVYFLFAYGIIRMSNFHPSVDSIAGVLQVYPNIGKVLAILALITVFKASLNLLLVFKEVFYRDFKMPLQMSYDFSFLISFLTLFFINVSFIKIISLVGAISVFLSALLICLIRLKLPHTWFTNLLVYIVLVILIFGLIAENF